MPMSLVRMLLEARPLAQVKLEIRVRPCHSRSLRLTIKASYLAQPMGIQLPIRPH